jgi:hypothetical protein
MDSEKRIEYNDFDNLVNERRNQSMYQNDRNLVNEYSNNSKKSYDNAQSNL